MTKEYFAQITNFEITAESVAGLLESGAFVVAGIVIVSFIILSVALSHHWREYGVAPQQIRVLRKVYYGVSGVFLVAMIISLISVVS